MNILKAKSSKLKAHANNVALPHTIFSLPFALASAFMASDGKPDFERQLGIRN